MLHSQFLLHQRPGVASARDAKDWIRSLPLTDARAAHHALETLIAEFEENSLEPHTRLEILETVRAQRVEVETQYAQRYTGKSLPLGEAERGAYIHALSLWHRAEEAYWECALAALGRAPNLRPRLALCLARAADLACERLRAASRAGQVPDGTAEAALVRYADLAREHGVLATPVPDSLHPKRFVSVASIHGRMLLYGLIGGTASGRERECAYDLAALWEAKVLVTWLPAGLTRALTRADLPPAVDPAKQRIRIIHVGGAIHFADVTALSRSLRKRVHMLGLGQHCSEAGLPPSFTHSGTSALLMRLHGAWCEEKFGRRHDRTSPPVVGSTHHKMEVAYGSNGNGTFDTMYCLFSGEPFLANEETDMSSRRRADEMFIFQGAGHARREHLMRAACRDIEEWQVLDVSETGTRLRRVAGVGRYKPGLLLALKAAPGRDEPLRLAEARWIAEAGTTELEAGLELLAAAPHPAAVRLTGVNAAGAKAWVACFHLRAPQGVHQLFTPAGWFKPNRIVEMKEDDKVGKWLFVTLKRRGADYEMIEMRPAG